MTRRLAGRGDPSVRAAVVARLEHLCGTFGTPGMVGLLGQARNRERLVLDSAALCAALSFVGDARGRGFSVARGGGDRRWLLDEHDVLTEIED